MTSECEYCSVRRRSWTDHLTEGLHGHRTLSNLKSAASLGLHTIRVEPASSLPAIRKLEQLTEMKLISDQMAQEEERRLRSSQAKL